MPHFFAKSLDFLDKVRECNSRKMRESAIDSPSRADKGGGLCESSGKYFDFLFEAKNLRDGSYLILAQNRADSRQKIMLIRQKKGDKFLVKFNKHFKIHSRTAIKNALKDYANLTNAEIISHNLNESKREAKSKYLLDSQGVLEILDSYKMRESSDLHKSTHPLAPSAREGEKKAGSRAREGESNASPSPCGRDLGWGIDSAREGESIVDLRFKNAPKFLEIGFGSGRHILNLAQNNPNALIIGLEIYRPAILQVLRQIEILNLTNLFVANIDARVLFEVIPRESLSEIFLHFPIPWEQNPQRRVFSKTFLNNAIRALDSQNGRFELLTDSKIYFDFAKKLARNYRTKTTINPQNAVISKYEARWRKLQKNIYKLEIFPQFNALYGAIFRLLDRFAPKVPQKMIESQNHTNVDLSKIRALLGKKTHKKEYFLQVKDIYEFGGGFVIYAVFGAYFAPNSAYFVVRENEFEMLGDVILSRANKSAICELKSRILGS